MIIRHTLTKAGNMGETHKLRACIQTSGVRPLLWNQGSGTGEQTLAPWFSSEAASHGGETMEVNERVWKGTNTRPWYMHKFNDAGLAVCSVRIRPRDDEYSTRTEAESKNFEFCPKCVAKD